MATGKIEIIKLKDLIQHRDLQAREALDEERIKFLTTVFDDWDALIAYRVGAKLYLTDGYHRFAAARIIGKEEVPVEVREGTFRDALECALTVNASSRIKPLSLHERVHACHLMLKVWTERSDRWIASDLGLNHETVGKLRIEMEATGEIRQLDKVISKDGKWRPREVVKKPTEPSSDLPPVVSVPPPHDVTIDHSIQDLMDANQPIHGTLKRVNLDDIIVRSEYLIRENVSNDMLNLLKIADTKEIMPMVVNQDLILIDGMTRLTFYRMFHPKEAVDVEVVQCPENLIVELAVYFNSGNDRGQGDHEKVPFSIEERKEQTILLTKMGKSVAEIGAVIKIKESVIEKWIADDSRTRMKTATSSFRGIGNSESNTLPLYQGRVV